MAKFWIVLPLRFVMARNARKPHEKLTYMHANPLNRGLVEDPKDWPWSRYAFYERRGEVLIEMNPVE